MMRPCRRGGGREIWQNWSLTGVFTSDRIMLEYLWKSAPHPTCRKASGGVILRGRWPMPSEPPVKRAFVFVDGQNLFHAAKEAFGYLYPI